MSAADSTDAGRGVYVPKPKADIYTVMLGISLGAIVFAIILLILELNAFDWDIKGEGARLSMGGQRDAVTQYASVVDSSGSFA
jgi:hypothetical protein